MVKSVSLGFNLQCGQVVGELAVKDSVRQRSAADAQCVGSNDVDKSKQVTHDTANMTTNSVGWT